MHKFRAIRPRLTDWIEIEGDTLEAAIQEYHSQNTYIYHGSNVLSVGINVSLEKQWFAVFETVDGLELISRICTTGIFRKGGVKPRGAPQTLADVARVLKVKLEDLEDKWYGEEEYQPRT